MRLVGSGGSGGGSSKSERTLRRIHSSSSSSSSKVLAAAPCVLREEAEASTSRVVGPVDGPPKMTTVRESARRTTTATSHPATKRPVAIGVVGDGGATGGTTQRTMPLRSMSSRCSNNSSGVRTRKLLMMKATATSARTVMLVPVIAATKKAAAAAAAPVVYREDISSDSFGIRSEHWWEDTRAAAAPAAMEDESGHTDPDRTTGWTVRGSSGKDTLPDLPIASSSSGVQRRTQELQKNCNLRGADQTLHEQSVKENKPETTMLLHPTLPRSQLLGPSHAQSIFLHTPNHPNEDQSDEDAWFARCGEDQSDVDAWFARDAQDLFGETETTGADIITRTAQSSRTTTRPNRRSTPKRTRSLDCFLLDRSKAQHADEWNSSMQIVGDYS
jgi:hypothetical protein